MEDENYTAEAVRDVINNTDPVLAMMSMMLREIAAGAVGTLVGIMEASGIDATRFPSEYLLQSILIEADKHLQVIDRETWIGLFDSYHKVKDILDENPELKEEFDAKHNTEYVPDIDQELKNLLDGNF